MQGLKMKMDSRFYLNAPTPKSKVQKFAEKTKQLTVEDIMNGQEPHVCVEVDVVESLTTMKDGVPGTTTTEKETNKVVERKKIKDKRTKLQEMREKAEGEKESD